MSLARPGSFAWLALHELRLALRARPRRGAARWIGYVLIAGWLAIGCLAGWALRDTPIPVLPEALIGVLAISTLGLSFMTAQAMIGSQRTLYESGTCRCCCPRRSRRGACCWQSCSGSQRRSC